MVVNVEEVYPPRFPFEVPGLLNPGPMGRRRRGCDDWTNSQPDLRTSIFGTVGWNCSYTLYDI